MYRNNQSGRILSRLRGGIRGWSIACLCLSISFASLLQISPAPAYAYDASTGDYPWHAAAHVPQPPASDNITWGFTDKATCDSKSSAYNCGAYKEGDYYVYDQWNYYLRNCTSYVAWRVAMEFGGDSSNLGNAATWDDLASERKGWTVDTSPEIGDIAQSSTAAGGLGHVGFVERVNSDGSVLISEYNKGLNGNFGQTDNYRAEKYIDVNGPNPAGFKLKVGVSTSSASSTVNATASTEDSPYGGDFNNDGYGDVAVIKKRSDNGVDLHILYGGAGTAMFSYNPTLARSLPGTEGWNWSDMKFAVGRFNSDSYSDLAIIHKSSTSVGASIHVMYGGSQPFQVNDVRRDMPASSAWNWSLMKVVSGDFNADGLDDIVIGHKLSDGGMDVHLLTGATGEAALANPDTARKRLAGPTWSWDNIKLAAGPFNSDASADLAIVHKRADGGLNYHVLKGATDTQSLTQEEGYVHELPGSSGWDWTKVKLSAGYFNSDTYADIAMLHKRADGGINAYVLYGQTTPLQTRTLHREMPSPAGWSWDDVKLAAGQFNADDYGDVALLHLNTTTSGIDVHVLYGGIGTAVFTYSPTYSNRSLPAPTWSWAFTRTI